jgi:DNA-binding NarL/FixJ family response regulator
MTATTWAGILDVVDFSFLEPEQRLVAQLIAEGHFYKEIATTIGITERAVAEHVSAIRAELLGQARAHSDQLPAELRERIMTA